jgi:hypothetical protein
LNVEALAKKMFVSFFFVLDQSAWPQQRKRPKQFYLDNVCGVLDLVVRNKHGMVLFSDDDEMLTLCASRGVHAVRRGLDSFWAWNQLDAIRRAMKPRLHRFNVPEFFSPEYVALQLCKFQALHDVSLTTQQACVWIDAGLLSSMLPQEPLLDSWSRGGIHITQFAPTAPLESWVTELPGAFVMGGCFGGAGPDVRRLFAASKSLLQELWENETSANDQQTLSLLYMRYPSMFHVQKAFTTAIPFIGKGKWEHVLGCMTSEFKEHYNDLRWIGMFAIAIAAVLATYKNAS